MSRQDETRQPERGAESDAERLLNTMIYTRKAEASALESILEQVRSLRRQLKQVEEQLQQTQKKSAEYETKGREWEQRSKEAKGQLDNARADAIRDALKKLGEAQVLSHLDELIRASQDTETPTQEGNNRPSLLTLKRAIENWINTITGSKLTKIFDGTEKEISSNETTGLVDFKPSNPFSDEVSKARCRVVYSGWQVVYDGNPIIIAPAILEPIKAISGAAEQSTSDAEASTVTPSDRASDLSVEAVSERADNQPSPVIPNNADESNEDAARDNATEDRVGKHPEQPEPQPDSPEFGLLKRATDMLEENKTFRDHERKLWDSFIQAAKSGQALSREAIDGLRLWRGGKAKTFSKIQLVLNEETQVREVFEEYWRKLIGESKPSETSQGDDAEQQSV